MNKKWNIQTSHPYRIFQLKYPSTNNNATPEIIVNNDINDEHEMCETTSSNDSINTLGIETFGIACTSQTLGRSGRSRIFLYNYSPCCTFNC
jgi:hypothetical protein